MLLRNVCCIFRLPQTDPSNEHKPNKHLSHYSTYCTYDASIFRLWKIWIETIAINPASILYKSTAGRYRPVRIILYKSTAGRHRPVSYPDGPITARCRFIKNAYWEASLSPENDIHVYILGDQIHFFNFPPFNTRETTIMWLPSNRVSDFRDFVYSLFPKAILFYFYFTLL